LSEITLGEAATAFAVDGEGLYISFGRRTARFNLDGSGESHLHNTAIDVSQLFSRNEFLYAHHASIVDSINKTTGAPIDSRDYSYHLNGVDVAPALGKAFGPRLYGNSFTPLPADLDWGPGRPD
jgi:hypothetical protein